MIETYSFNITPDLIISLADEFQTTQTNISIAIFALLVHRYTFNSNSVEVFDGENKLTIIIKDNTFQNIISSIQVNNVDVISFHLCNAPNINGTTQFVNQRFSFVINQYHYDENNIIHRYQLTFSNEYLDKKIVSDLCSAFQNLVYYLGNNTLSTRSLSYNQLVSIPLVTKNTAIEGRTSLAITEIFHGNTIYDHFRFIANQHRDRICLQRKTRYPYEITYLECITLVDQMVSVLKDKLEIKPGSSVGLWMENSFEYIICILATLKSDAIFVPLDIKHPPERLEMIEKESLLNVILTNNSTLTTSIHSPTFNAPTVRISVTMNKKLEIETSQNTVNSCINPSLKQESKIKFDAGYIIFTSGSTGRPKGVLVEENNLLNMVLSQINIFGIQSSDVVAQFASICFDASLSEIFMALLAGASLVIFDSSMDRVGTQFINILNQFYISVITLPPSLLSTIDPQQTPYIRIVISAGESCPKGLGQKWIECNRRFFNAYGPSEVAVCATIYEFDRKKYLSSMNEDTLPIGTLIDNLSARVVDSQLNDVPAGMPGELVLGGIGVSRHGYLNSAQNNVFFIWQQQRWYRTGDIVVTIGPDHKTFSYLGRKDAQVKFYGCRIELNEIEMAILSCSNVTYCVAVLHKCDNCTNDQGAIVAYVDGSATIESIRENIGQVLPSYMMPSFIIQTLVANLPLTLSGKINRQLLITDKSIHSEHTHHTFLTNDEEKLAILWREVFYNQSRHITNVQIKNHTIAQLGGNSLSVALLHHLIVDQFAVNVCIDAHMSLTDMAKLLSQNENNNLVEYESMMNDLNDDLNYIEMNNTERNSPSSPSNQISTLLLTGATGFLGSFLLHEILKTTSMTVFVPLRANSLDEAINRLQSILTKYGLFDKTIQQIFNNERTKRVQVYLCENLANKNQVDFDLGFGKDQWNHIDAVLHCAADTNFNATYNQLQQVNVLATKYFIRQCLHYSIPLYYVSSLSIFLFSEKNDLPICIKETDKPHLQSIIGGYGQSKYIADTLVLRSLQRNLKGLIFRPGRITGSFMTGIGTNDDLFVLMLRGCYELGAYPQLTFPFDMTPVDLVSKSIIDIMCHRYSLKQSNTSPIHLVNTKTIPFDEQFKLLHRLGCFSKQLEALPYNEWRKKLIDRVEIERQNRSTRFNPLLPLIPFLKSFFWDNVDRWPVFERTNEQDAILDRSPNELFEIYSRVWKQLGFF